MAREDHLERVHGLTRLAGAERGLRHSEVVGLLEIAAVKIRLRREEELIGARGVSAAQLGEPAPDQPLFPQRIALHAGREDAQNIFRLAVVPLRELAPAQRQRDRAPARSAGIVLEVFVQEPVVRRGVLAQGRGEERGFLAQPPRELRRVDSLEEAARLLDAPLLEGTLCLGQTPLLHRDPRLAAHGSRAPEALLRARLRGRGSVEGAEKESGRGHEARENQGADPHAVVDPATGCANAWHSGQRVQNSSDVAPHEAHVKDATLGTARRRASTSSRALLRSPRRRCTFTRRSRASTDSGSIWSARESVWAASGRSPFFSYIRASAIRIRASRGLRARRSS